MDRSYTFTRGFFTFEATNTTPTYTSTQISVDVPLADIPRDHSTKERVRTAKAHLTEEERTFCYGFLLKLSDAARGITLPKNTFDCQLPMHMISVRNVAVRPMVQYPHFDDLSFLTGQELQYAFLAMYQAGRRVDKSIQYHMNGVSRALFPNPERAINMLWALGFFQIDTIENMLSVAKTDELKAMLQRMDLKVPAKKQDRVNIVLANISDEELYSMLASNERFFLSPLGFFIVQSLYYEMGQSVEVEQLRKELGVDDMPISAARFLQDSP